MRACVHTYACVHRTQDLALCIYGKNMKASHWQETFEFLKTLAANLEKKLDALNI